MQLLCSCYLSTVRSCIRFCGIVNIPYVSLLISSFPNKMVLGRTHIKEVAAKRKLELYNYVHNLMRSSTEVTQVHISDECSIIIKRSGTMLVFCTSQ